jgi:hypothetical protein
VNPFSNERGFSHTIILVVLIEKRIFQEHFLEWAFILNRETVWGLVVAFLVDDGVDDVEEYFFVRLNRIGTQGTTQSADDFEHGITSSYCLYPTQNPNPFKTNKKTLLVRRAYF